MHAAIYFLVKICYAQFFNKQQGNNMTNIIDNNQLTNVLMDALHACNLAGSMTYDDMDKEIRANNINPKFQVEVTNILCAALRIVNPELLEVYIETGDRQYAPFKAPAASAFHRAVDAGFKGTFENFMLAYDEARTTGGNK